LPAEGITAERFVSDGDGRESLTSRIPRIIRAMNCRELPLTTDLPVVLSARYS
jgi:hypothetical protein